MGRKDTKNCLAILERTMRRSLYGIDYSYKPDKRRLRLHWCHCRFLDHWQVYVPAHGGGFSIRPPLKLS